MICLQEVWADAEVEFAAELAEGLGFHQVYGSRLDFDGVRFGNAVLSRWPITGARSWRCRRVPTPRRCAPACAPTSTVPAGRSRCSAPTSTGGSTRAVCGRTRCGRSARSSTARSPTVAGRSRRSCAATSTRIPTATRSGCSPAVPTRPCRSWSSTTRGRSPVEASDSSDTGATWSNDNPYAKRDLEPDRRIDYVLVGWPKAGGAGHVTRCTVEGLEPVDGVVPSDHLAVLAELRY